MMDNFIPDIVHFTPWHKWVFSFEIRVNFRAGFSDNFKASAYSSDQPFILQEIIEIILTRFLYKIKTFFLDMSKKINLR